jgi:predicted ester cyclase
MTEPELHALTERHQEAWRRRDPVALASCHHPDAVIVSPMFATARGRAAIESSYAVLFATFPDLEITVDAMVMDPTHVASFETFRATHANEFFGHPGTNKPIEISLARLMTLENGFITHQRLVYDFTGLLVQIGVLRAKPGKP